MLKWLGESRAGLLEELGDLDCDPGINRGGTRVLREILEAAGAAVGVAETLRTPRRGGEVYLNLTSGLFQCSSISSYEGDVCEQGCLGP